MSHEILENDKVEGVERFWHGLNEVKEKIELFESWLSKWEAVPTKLHLPDGTETPFSAFTASDNPNMIIGKPFADETYGIVNNSQFLQVLSDSFQGIEHQIYSVGSVKNRKQVFVTIRLVGLEKFNAAGREHEAFLNAINGFDQATALSFITSNIATVCANTVAFNLRHKGQLVDCRFIHHKGIIEKIENMPQIIEAAIETQNGYIDQLNQLAEQKVTHQQARDCFIGFLHGKVNEPISTRRVNVVNRLCELFRSGAGNKGENKADMFGAVTDFFTHENAGGENKMKQFASSEFGNGADKKREFLLILLDNEVFEKTIEYGKQAIEKTRQGSEKEKARLDNLLFAG